LNTTFTIVRDVSFVVVVTEVEIDKGSCNAVHIFNFQFLSMLFLWLGTGNLISFESYINYNNTNVVRFVSVVVAITELLIEEVF